MGILNSLAANLGGLAPGLALLHVFAPLVIPAMTGLYEDAEAAAAYQENEGPIMKW